MKKDRLDTTDKVASNKEAKAALAHMKKLEKKRQPKMVSCRIDAKTVVSSSKDRIGDFVAQLKKPQVVSRSNTK